MSVGGVVNDLASTMTVGGLGMSAGAVYTPVSEMVPHADFEQPGPETLHVSVFGTAFPEVENCWGEPAGT